MNDLGRDVLEIFAEAQERFAVWTRPLHRQTRRTLQQLDVAARHRVSFGRRRETRCSSCGRRGHNEMSCINADEWNTVLGRNRRKQRPTEPQLKADNHTESLMRSRRKGSGRKGTNQITRTYAIRAKRMPTKETTNA